jgi:16S rRNA (cytosine967-C5)-methyltransferase
MQEQLERTYKATPRALTAAIEIYARWEAERERSPLDRVVEAEFRSRRSLNSGERRWIAELVYGAARFARRQAHLLALLGLPITSDARIRLWASAPAAPDGAPLPATAPPSGFAPLVSPERLDAALAALPGPDTPREYLRITRSFPDAMADALESLLSADAPAAAAALNAQAPTTLRVNTLRATRAQVQAALPEAVSTHFSPWGLELPRRVNLYDLPGFRAGWFETQEEASQLAALLTDAQPGQTVVEVGAGAGGKTLALAALLQNRGRLVALDTSEAKLEELEKRAARAGATCAETLRVLAAEEEGQWQPSGAARKRLSRLYNRADVVLVDAPCTGSGVLRRSPDAKWREADIPAFARLQQALLAQASALVAPGGRLVYVTCAFERSQNEAVVEAFLASPPGQAFALEPALPRLLAARQRLASISNETTASLFDSLAAGPYFRSWPHRHGLDAFFAAVLRRT